MRSTIILIPFCFSVLFSCCNSDRSDQKKQTITESLSLSEELDTTNNESSMKIDYSDSLNCFDSNGWKQGRHITKNKWDITLEDATYVNDTIVGYFSYWDGMRKDGFYENGKKNGNWNWYSDGTILLITHYENDSIIWHAPYIANKEAVIPHKDFSPVANKFYMKAPHPNGNLWYEGLYVNKKPVGIHKVYFENGKQKGLIDYSKLFFEEYDTDGKIITRDTIIFYGE